MVNKPLIGANFWGGMLGRGRLTSQDAVERGGKWMVFSTDFAYPIDSKSFYGIVVGVNQICLGHFHP